MKNRNYDGHLAKHQVEYLKNISAFANIHKDKTEGINGLVHIIRGKASIIANSLTRYPEQEEALALRCHLCDLVLILDELTALAETLAEG